MENRPAKRREKEVGSDRISRLPESVLVHILCFLSQKKAVQTSVLSKSWRHLGYTRPVIELRGVCDYLHLRQVVKMVCENCFNGNNEAFVSALDNVFQRYHDQNLTTHELRLQMLEVDSRSHSVIEKWIPEFLKPNSRVTMFRFSVDNWECCYSDRTEYERTHFDLPSAVFEAESLENLYLNRCIIISIENVRLNNLRKLSLIQVLIDDQTLGKIMCGCPLVEYVELRCCRWLNTISILGNHNQNLKDFKFIGCHENNLDADVIEIDVPALRSIHIERCSNWKWKLNRDNYFPHLKSLYLFFVQLSTEFFENFSRNFPLLEELALSRCHGFDEIKLLSHSLKRLTVDLKSSASVDIDAPNIIRFMFSGEVFPTRISIKTASTEWKSHITLNNCGYVYSDALPRLLKLNEMVKALSPSEISLDLYDCLLCQSRQIEHCYNDPVIVQHLGVNSTKLFKYSFDCLFNVLFQMFRPRYVGALRGLRTDEVTKRLWETLGRERENREYYYWQQHLEEVSIEASEKGVVWHHVQGTCLPERASSNNKKIRFRLKWRN